MGEPAAAAAGLLQLYFLPPPRCHGGLSARESPFYERGRESPLLGDVFEKKPGPPPSLVDVTDKNIACMCVRCRYCTLGPTADVVIARHADRSGGKGLER